MSNGKAGPPERLERAIIAAVLTALSSEVLAAQGSSFPTVMAFLFSMGLGFVAFYRLMRYGP